MRRTVALAVVVLALATGLVWLTVARSGAPRERAREPVTLADDSSAAEIAALRARIETLERAFATPQSPTRTPVEDPSPTRTESDLLARIEALERELRELERLRTPPEAEDDADALIARLNKNRGTYAASNAEALKERQALRERFLQLFPDDPRAAGMLEELAGEHLTNEPAQAVAALDRWRGRVKIDPWRFESNYANALGFAGRLEDADRTYQSIVNSADAPDHARWDARFFAAYLHARRGDQNEARRRFQAIVRELEAMGSPPGLQSVLGGAQSQLQMLAPTQPR